MCIRDRLRMIWSGGLDFLANETYVYVPEIHQAQNGGDNGFIEECAEKKPISRNATAGVYFFRMGMITLLHVPIGNVDL